ncbi:hypothetical protein EFO33_12515 [Lactococcus cremoris]|nr:hypothetical protein [Lactococcus cremoris]MCT4429668.1 hypothetical protein [Lactococcus cremoris]
MAVFMCWGFILSIFIFLALSILVIYSDGIISILVIIGFPITNWEDVIYSLFCMLSILVKGHLKMLVLGH